MDFDKRVNRDYTEATKWEKYRNVIQDKEQIPMWIADMDLACSEAIQDALLKRAKHPIYGYSDRDVSYLELFAKRFNDMHNYQVTADNIVLSTGVIYAITCALRLFSKQGDHVVILSPSYAPFTKLIEHCKRKVVRSEMVKGDERYEIDFDDLDAKLADAKVLLLCNPHNPTGRVFDHKEVTQMAKLCEKHNIVIISDEIHADITYDHHDFVPIMNVSEYTKAHTIACVSPTKTFNMAGLKISGVIIKNRSWYKTFQKEAAMIGISSINVFAMQAIKAAYLQSDEWEKENRAYLKANRNRIKEYFASCIPDIQSYQPEGTYFYWIDLSNYQESDKLLEKFLDHGLILSGGLEFSPLSKNFVRLNFACSKEQLECCLEVMKEVLTGEKLK